MGVEYRLECKGKEVGGGGKERKWRIFTAPANGAHFCFMTRFFQLRVFPFSLTTPSDVVTRRLHLSWFRHRGTWIMGRYWALPCQYE